MRPELRLLNLHFFNICRHHPTLKFKPHATDDERYVSGVDGVPLNDTRLCPHAGIIFGATKMISTTPEINSASAKMIFATAELIRNDRFGQPYIIESYSELLLGEEVTSLNLRVPWKFRS